MHKIPFPSQVIVTLQNEESFSCPPGDFWEKVKGEIKVFFDRKLELDIWGDLEANLLDSVQWLPLFKQEKLMVKIVGMMEDWVNGKFNFKVFLSKRPEVWPSCELDEVSDDEKAPPNVLFCMEARVKIITMDSLQKSSALLAGNIKSSMF